MNTKRILVSILVGAVVCGVAWLGGFDFNERGFDAAATAIFSMAAFIASYTCPIWWIE